MSLCGRRALWLGVLVALAALPAWAQDGAGDAARPPVLKRHAIVVGNGAYDGAPDLGNAIADASLVADFLAEQGYQVREYVDLSKRGFEGMLRRALYEIDKDSEVVFYYAGHGVQIAGGNYLVPTDATLDSAYDVPFETVSLTSVVSILGARARLQLVILDSCRDNPFGATRVVTDLSSGLSEVRDGFNLLTAPINSFLAFSTAPGQVAYDGDPGANSPFTGAMVEVARAGPETPVSQVFERVRRLVHERTEGRQTPWESSTLVEPASFRPAAQPDGPAEAGAGLGSFPAAQVRGDAAATGEVLLTGPLEPELSVGPALASSFATAPGAPLTVTEHPRTGRLLVLDAYDRRLNADAITVAADLSRLVYASAFGDAPEPRLSDGFTVAVGEAERAVKIALRIDPCDDAAGDHLDPGGVGVARFPNEIAPEAARGACLAAVAARPDVARFHYQLGRAELALRRFDAARGAFETARRLGHVRAIHALGLMVATADAEASGKTDAPAPEAALALYREGVALGDPYAFHALGKQLLRHGRTEAERQEGFELLSRALELGHTFSMNELGAYFIDPDAPASDPPRGLRYFEESAARGDIYGYNNMGFVHLRGLAGVPADPEAARAWFERAAAGGHPEAPGNLGRLWNSGALGSVGRYAEAVRWYDLGLERGDGWSGANAAWIIAERGVEGLTLANAAERAAKAAALGDAEAAASAREVLAALPASALDGGAQRLVNALGGAIAVDGAFGPASRAEMARVLDAHGASPPPDDPVERAVALASAYWKASKFRVDLY
jgi:TPR repeat protein